MKPATLSQYPESQQILQHNRKFIPGGVVSVNRATQPELTFVRAEGASMWDADGNRYIDYHAAFAPYFLGHNDPDVTEAVLQAINCKTSLFGSGTTVLEGELAEAFCDCVPTADSVQLMNTGSEATAQAIRLARAATGRDHIIVVQGSYNGWHNDVSCNVMTPLAILGERVSPGEYPYLSMSAGVPVAHQQLIHVV
ncbi:MAG: aminotransferase class III-fold pyridoxal phosphate-dependent enzyme, partial [Edaphobacter sp.]